jgi:anion-transporting  ArsA/GET3 family ATPase
LSKLPSLQNLYHAEGGRSRKKKKKGYTCTVSAEFLLKIKTTNHKSKFLLVMAHKEMYMYTGQNAYLKSLDSIINTNGMIMNYYDMPEIANEEEEEEYARDNKLPTP